MIRKRGSMLCHVCKRASQAGSEIGRWRWNTGLDVSGCLHFSMTEQNILLLTAVLSPCYDVYHFNSGEY